MPLVTFFPLPLTLYWVYYKGRTVLYDTHRVWLAKSHSFLFQLDSCIRQFKSSRTLQLQKEEDDEEEKERRSEEKLTFTTQYTEWMKERKKERTKERKREKKNSWTVATCRVNKLSWVGAKEWTTPTPKWSRIGTRMLETLNLPLVEMDASCDFAMRDWQGKSSRTVKASSCVCVWFNSLHLPSGTYSETNSVTRLSFSSLSWRPFTIYHLLVMTHKLY